MRLQPDATLTWAPWDPSVGNLHYLQSQQSKGPGSHSPRYQGPGRGNRNHLSVKARRRCLLRVQSSLQATQGSEESGDGRVRKGGADRLYTRGRTSHCSTGRGREHITVKRLCPPSMDPSPVPVATHQTIFIVLGHLTDKLIQLQAAGANDLDPEVVRMFRGRDIDF